MKLFYVFMMLLVCTLGACSKNESEVDKPDDSDDEVVLDLSVTDLVFEAQGGKKEFEITCDSKWSITHQSDWCEVDVSSGKGNKSVTVSVRSYSGTADRNANLTVKAGNRTIVLTVTQKSENAIILSKSKLDVPQEGGEVTVKVKSGIEYEVKIPAGFRDWIQQAPESKAEAEKSITFTISENEGDDKREGYILFSGDSREDTVFIYQAQKNQLVLNRSTYAVPTAGAEIAVELKTNIDYEVRIPGDATSWISQISTKAIREDLLKFQVAAHTGSDERTARIVIQDKNSDLSDTVRVIQASKDTYGGDLVWKTEQDLIDFHTAGHTKVIGNIVVQGDEIKTLQRLDNLLTEIDGSITFCCGTLSTFDGLYGLKKISGDLIVQEGVMTSFEGLQNLGEIGGSFKVIASSPSSSSFSLLSSLTSFGGLGSLKRISGDFEVNASSDNYYSLNKLSSFEGLDALEEIGGSFKVIASSPAFSSLVSFSGLENLKKIGGDFEVKASSYYRSSKLSSFEGLEALEEIGGSFTSSCLSSLTSFSALRSLRRIGGNFEVTASSSGFNYFFEGLEGLEEIGGSFSISSLYFLDSFDGLEGLKKIGEKKLNIANCGSLYNIDALSNVDALDEISITGCPQLYDFCVLKNVVQNMSGTFYVEKNGYNPTKYQLLNGACSPTPENNE
ncbi:MAG: BACON domain-containing protein [Odoribacter sp.]|nr:BACON domain-containing protein [Odoribacter sp.]